MVRNGSTARLARSVLPAAVAALLATALEAIGAVDRLVVARDERNHRLLAAFPANGRVHGALLVNAAATTETHTLSLLDDLPISISPPDLTTF